MNTYVLSYVSHTGIKQGEYRIHSNEKLETIEFTTSNDKTSIRRAEDIWATLLISNKQASAAIQFVGLQLKRDVDWTPELTKVRWDESARKTKY